MKNNKEDSNYFQETILIKRHKKVRRNRVSNNKLMKIKKTSLLKCLYSKTYRRMLFS